MSREAAIRDIVRAGKRVAARASAPALLDRLAQSTGLSPEMARRALARNLEREVSDEDLARILAWAGDEVDEVALVLSAGVLTSPLRALILARAAGRRVTVHPSRRDPAFAELLVEELGATNVRLGGRFDGAAFEGDELHAYGSDASVATLRTSVRAGVRVRSHGNGFGIAWVERPDDAAARALAEDVIDFDQRGCLSPRIVFAHVNAEELAVALSAELGALAKELPRAPLTDDERVALVRFREGSHFVGIVHQGPEHTVVLAHEDTPIFLGPTGRTLLVFPAHSLESTAKKLHPLAVAVTAVGTDVRERAPELAMALGVPHARVAALGTMQTPPLDGPVDLRPDP